MSSETIGGDRSQLFGRTQMTEMEKRKMMEQQAMGEDYVSSSEESSQDDEYTGAPKTIRQKLSKSWRKAKKRVSKFLKPSRDEEE
jgi:hypothetical protein